MRRFALITLALAGCLHNPTVEVDKDSLDVPRGASSDVRVSIDGFPVDDLELVAWEVDDPELVTALPAWDGRHVRIGGNLEGDTIVRINVHGQTLEIPTRVGPPAIVEMWIEPTAVTTSMGELVPIKALALDTMFRLRDVTHESRWVVRDPGVAILDPTGMMLYAAQQGRTTLHATNGTSSTVVPITVLK